MDDLSSDPGPVSIQDYLPFDAKLEEIKGLLCHGLVTSDSVDRVLKLLDLYQEIPELIDPCLQTIVNMIVSVMKSDQLEDGSAMLYSLCKVRGATTVSKFLPHAVSDFKFVLALLHSDHNFSWQTRYCLLSWMSVLVLIPFSLDTVFSSCSVSPTEDLLQKFSTYLLLSGPTSTAAARAIARLLSRNDSDTSILLHFMQWSQAKLASSVSDLDSTENMNCTIGVLTALVQLLKTAARMKVLSYLVQITYLADYAQLSLFQTLDILPMELAQSKSVVLRKLSLKLFQRIGMSFLPAGVASCRYKMGRRSLLHNLDPGFPSSNSIESPDETAAGCDFVQPKRALEDVPWQHLESILDKLLLGICNSDTVVRWSAAKGIGRCTMRLEREMADDVLSNILSIFETSSASARHYWHGGLLALAEFCRRGILLPHRLETVVPIVCQGMVFEETLGTHSVGSNVRDAACYVAWSFARAYLPKEIAPYSSELSSGLMNAALFDREVNVRRAACAAFQENVGRHGLFPSGIACNTLADYFTIGNIMHSYKAVAVAVSEHQHYTDAMISHLVTLKISHWDCSLRVLACESLAALCGLLPDFGCGRIVPDLVVRSLSDSIPERHGSLTAISRILEALHQSGKPLSIIDSNLQSDIRNLVTNVEKARLYRGRGGEFVRCAICELVLALSCLRFPLQLKTVKRYQLSINENLVHPNENVRNAAVKCLAAFSDAYYDMFSMQDIEEIIRRFVSELKSSFNVAVTRGFASALGSLPLRCLKENIPDVCHSLMAASQPIQVAERLDPQTRQEALKSLVAICSSLRDRIKCGLGNVPENLAKSIHFKIVDLEQDPDDLTMQCISCLLLSLDDYATDNRGDVGSWVRMTALSGLEQMATCLIANGSCSQRIAISIVSAILKQSMEKLDKVRRLSGETLTRLLCLDLDIPLTSKLRGIFSPGIDWSSAAVSFALLTPLLRYPEFRIDLYSGLVISAGGMTETIAKHALQSLSSLLSQVNDETKSLSRSLIEFSIELLIRENVGVRIVIPVFGTLSQLLLLPAVKSSVDEALVDRVRNQILKKCCDLRLVSIHLASIDVLCTLIQYNRIGAGIAHRNFAALVSTLQHKIFKVRKVCAEKLYSNLVALDCDAGLSLDDLHKALNALVCISGTTEADVTDLCEALHVIPKKKKTVKVQVLNNDKKEFHYQDLIHQLGN